MEIGGFITFNIDYWTLTGQYSLKTIKAEIQKFILDPLGRREQSLYVTFEDQSYGIPISEVISYSPPVGTQLSLF